jgi:hypothetical protein
MAGALAITMAGPVAAQTSDDFQREGDRTRKDPLEGQPPPELDVTGWMNTDGEALSLADLRGRVVVLDFWGVW